MMGVFSVVYVTACGDHVQLASLFPVFSTFLLKLITKWQQFKLVSASQEKPI